VSQPKLSICIPTYNRAKYLPELLDSIIVQAPTDGALEITVSDNASTDNTEELIKTYQQKFPFIIYHRNSENLGADRNFLKCVEIASGEYCWLMGSDDKLVEDAIESILITINKKCCEIIICENIGCYHNMLPRKVQHKKKIKGGSSAFDFSKKEDILFFGQQANGLPAVFSYLSIIIFEKKYWTSVSGDIPYFIFGTLYAHVYVLMSIVKKYKPIIFYLDKSFVFSRPSDEAISSCLTNQDMAYRIFLDFYYIDIVNNIFFDDFLIREVFLNILKKELVFRYYRSYRPLWIKINSDFLFWDFCMKLYKKYFGWKLSIFFAYSSPRFLNNFIFKMFYYIKKIKYLFY
jgi:abequosyltransferase